MQNGCAYEPGIVAWQACRHFRRGLSVEDFEVAGSHLGMGWNGNVMQILDERVAHREKRGGNRSRVDSVHECLSARVPESCHRDDQDGNYSLTRRTHS